MTASDLPSGDEIAAGVNQAGLTIYDPINRDDSHFYDIKVLEAHLRTKLHGLNLNYANRTRSKVAKEAVARAMGYPVPASFRRSQPRFPGQELDVYVQKSDNLQIWNEEVQPNRRYALIRVDENGRVITVRIVTGETIAFLDRTGTLTQKYQAKRRAGNSGSRLVSGQDTVNFRSLLAPANALSAMTLADMEPSDRPVPGQVLSIQALYTRLLEMAGQEIADPGIDQERNRGGALQRLACEALGLARYGDAAQFPDILCQAVEVKLQTSPTIDLGLVSPDSTADAEEVGPGIHHRDVRYAVAYGQPVGDNQILIADIVVATGEDFFTEFQRFEGLVINRKRQIRLPVDFFR